MNLSAGDIYLHPARVPHSPIRKEGEKDGLLWFCDNCNNKLHDEYFVLESIEKDFIPVFKEFYGSEDMRTCDKCGTVMEVDERFV